MKNILTITSDPCAECGKSERCDNGLCLRCTTSAIEGRDVQSKEARAVAARLASELDAAGKTKEGNSMVRKLTQDEIAERGKALAAKHLEFTEEEAAQKLTKSLLKQRLDSIVDDMERLAKEIRTGETELDDQPDLPMDAVKVEGGEIAGSAEGESQTSDLGMKFAARHASESVLAKG